MNWRRWTYFIFWIDPNFHSQTRLHTSKENVWNKDIGDTNSALFLYKSAHIHICYKEGSRIYENLLWFSFPWGACLWEGLNCTRSSETCSSPAPTLHTYYISHILHITYILYITLDDLEVNQQILDLLFYYSKFHSGEPPIFRQNRW